MRFIVYLLGSMLVSILVFSGCGLLSLDENSDKLSNLIERNLEEWNQKDIYSYKFKYNKTVGDVERENIEVFVVNEGIDSINVDGRRVENPSEFLTIDRLYDEIEKNFNRDDRGTFRVSFNEEFSYPMRYRMEAGDDTKGRGVVVTAFDTTSEGR